MNIRSVQNLIGYRKRVILFILFFSLIVAYPENLFSQENVYPTDERLFHIARSKNKNLVCYDANLENGILNTKKPLNIYWLNREENPGKTNGLSAIQRNLAYGYKLISQNNDSCMVTLSAYPSRKLTIKKLGEKYACIMLINGQPAKLTSLFVKAKSGNSLSVEYIELFGIDLKTDKPISEKVIK